MQGHLKGFFDYVEELEALVNLQHEHIQKMQNSTKQPSQMAPSMAPIANRQGRTSPYVAGEDPPLDKPAKL